MKSFKDFIIEATQARVTSGAKHQKTLAGALINKFPDIAMSDMKIAPAGSNVTDIALTKNGETINFEVKGSKGKGDVTVFDKSVSRKRGDTTAASLEDGSIFSKLVKQYYQLKRPGISKDYKPTFDDYYTSWEADENILQQRVLTSTTTLDAAQRWVDYFGKLKDEELSTLEKKIKIKATNRAKDTENPGEKKPRMVPGKVNRPSNGEIPINTKRFVAYVDYVNKYDQENNGGKEPSGLALDDHVSPSGSFPDKYWKIEQSHTGLIKNLLFEHWKESGDDYFSVVNSPQNIWIYKVGDKKLELDDYANEEFPEIASAKIGTYGGQSSGSTRVGVKIIITNGNKFDTSPIAEPENSEILDQE